MSLVKLKSIIALLKEFSQGEKEKIEIILIGGLALHYYGRDRMTIDVDGEVNTKTEELINFLRQKNIPADLGEDISKWSIISMPKGYRKRAMEVLKDRFLSVKVLSPVDFIVSKLRRFTEEDIADALFVARKFKLKKEAIKRMAQQALKDSPKDSAIFLFKQNVRIFLGKLSA